MRSTLVTGIGQLVTCDGTGPEGLGVREDTALVVQNGLIAWVGPANSAPSCDERLDVEGRTVVPGFVDSHAHLVFAGDRAGERYDGGGIGVSVAATRAASDDELRALVGRRVAEMRAQGTTTVEIKSG